MYCAKFSTVSIIANMEFDILQFDDDTIITGNTYWSNIWSIKSVLCGLEFASVLRAIFHKSKIFGCNVETSFLEAISDFLSFPISSLPFNFLGIPIGINPCKGFLMGPCLVKSIVDLPCGKEITSKLLDELLC